MFKKSFAVLLAMTMVVSFTACKKNDSETTSSDDVEYIEQIEYEYQSGTQGSADAATSGGNRPSGSKKPSGGNSSTGGNSKVNPEKYRGTTVRYATWKDPELNEDGPTVKAFEKKYGIKVKIDLVSQANYNNTIASMIASDDSPDVYFCNMFFPECLTTMQPIDAAQLDLTDPIWDKVFIDKFTVNGKAYIVNSLGSPNGAGDVLYFNKTVLKQAGFTKEQFPDKLYEKGVWTWDALETIMSTVKTKLGSQGYQPAFLHYDSILTSTGCNMFKYENNKFSLNISDPFLVTVNERLADWYTKGYIKDYNTDARDEFTTGKVAIAAIDAFGLRKKGYWQNMNQDAIGFTYLPDFDSSHKRVDSGLSTGWGIVKGAKNPVAAGIFLRYYLDGNNYDTSKFFINEQAESFFFQLTSKGSSNRNFALTWNNYMVALTQPANVKTKLASMQNTLQEQCNYFNNIIAKNAQ